MQGLFVADSSWRKPHESTSRFG